MAEHNGDRCCQCNGPGARCVRCVCAKKRSPCVSCRLYEDGLCCNPHNRYSSRLASSPSPDPPRAPLASSSPSSPSLSQVSTPCPTSSPSLSSSLSDSTAGPTVDPRGGHFLERHEIDNLLSTAYGASLCQPSATRSDSVWFNHWSKVTQLSGRLYMIPRGPCGRRYISTLCDEIDHLSRGNYSSERVIVFSSVVLQCDRMVKKTRDICRTIERRLDLWSSDNFDLLIQEASRCDRPFQATRRSSNNDHIEKVFTRLMFQGKIRAAMRWLTERSKGNVLNAKDSVKVSVNGTEESVPVVEALRLKHPSSQPPHSSTLLQPNELPLLEEVEVTGAHISLIARRIQGSAGPGGCDSSHWQDALLRFGTHSRRLCDSVAVLSRCLSNSIFDWDMIQALLANRLIALDKCPGIRPIGVGETLRRIIGKAVCYVTREDVESICGVSQLCAGLKHGIEGAIHAMNDIFTDNDDHGILMVDARNAFNSVNRTAMLWNVRVLWPRACRFVFNTYRGWSQLVLKKCDDKLFSREGVVQGDPMSMFVYAVATVPLIRELEDISIYKQVWYADDSSVTGDLNSIRVWFENLLSIGPHYGYFPEPSKSCLVVHASMTSEAQSIFKDLGVKISTSCRYLGGVIGSDTGINDFISLRVKEWVHHIELLSNIAINQPQAAYAAMTKSMQHEWSFLQRVSPHCSSHFEAIEKQIISSFLPSLFGCDSSTEDRLLYSLPARMGGLGITNPSTTADFSYNTSRDATKYLTDAIKGLSTFSISQYSDMVSRSHTRFIKDQQELHESTYTLILNRADSSRQRIIKRNRTSLSAWLTATPIQKDNFDLSATEFRDALGLRYAKPLLLLPPSCDGCGSVFTTSHALDCKKGGLITQRHNEVRDLLYDLSSIVWTQTTKEPVVREASSDSVALIADISSRGVWQPQSTAVFDLRVIDSDAPSYLSKSVESVLRTAEREKKQKYNRACESRHATFTPLCTTIDGSLGTEMNHFLKKLADKLSHKWDQHYGLTLHWIRTKLSFALIRATSLCIRGSRSRWRGLGSDDGLGINPLFL